VDLEFAAKCTAGKWSD